MSNMLSLRGYQRDGLDMIYDDLARIQRPSVLLATGLGKTIMFVHMIVEWTEAHQERAIILVHRDELATQAVEKIRTVAPHLSVGRIQGTVNEVDADVIVASVQTLWRDNRLAALKESFPRYRRTGLVVVDECFPAGTRVGGTPIEKIKVGDLVPTWNEKTGREEVRPVTRLYRKRPSAMVRVILGDGSEFACTPNHPILTDQGWCPAGMLPCGASVISFTHDAATDGSPLHGVRDAGNDHRTEGHGLPAPEPGLLLRSVPGHLGVQGPVPADGQDEPGTRFGTDAPGQPDAPARVPGEDGRHAKADQAQAACSGRERFGSFGAAEKACGVPGLADRGSSHTRGRGASISLQGGHSSPVHESGRGGGRGIPLLSGAPVLRPEAGRQAVRTRVADVQVLEPGGDGTYGGVCPDSHVYNLKVDTTHTYLIGDGLVVHNCHHAASPTYVKIMRSLGCYTKSSGVKAVGFTATMARGDGVGLGSVWQRISFSRSVLWGISKGYLVDLRQEEISAEALDLAAVKRSGTAGDFTQESLGQALIDSGSGSVIARAYREFARDRAGVAFSPTVAAAEYLAEDFRTLGITSAVVTAGTDRQTRRQIYEDSRSGKVQVIHNCGVLTEGFDAPWLSCVIPKPTMSEPLFQQMVGRVTRTYPRKKDGLVLGVSGSTGVIRTLADMEPGTVSIVRPGESLAEAVVREAEESNASVPAGSPAFELRRRQVDMFAGSSSVWLRTPAGVMFVPLAEGEIVLWPSRDEAGMWDVRYAARTAKKWPRLHRSLTLDMAMAWGETEAEDLEQDGALSVASRSASWRRKKAPVTPGQVQALKARGLKPEDFQTKQGASDALSVWDASMRFDRFVSRAKVDA